MGYPGAGDSNYTGFTLNPGGHLRPLAGSPVAVPAGVADVLISWDGTHLVGVRVGTATWLQVSLISLFTTNCHCPRLTYLRARCMI